MFVRRVGYFAGSSNIHDRMPVFDAEPLNSQLEVFHACSDSSPILATQNRHS